MKIHSKLQQAVSSFDLRTRYDFESLLKRYEIDLSKDLGTLRRLEVPSS